MKYFLRKVRVALTPRHWRLRTRLACGAVVCGQNRAGYGGRYIYIFRETIEPEFQQLEKFLVSGGVLMDIGGNTGIYTVKAAQYFRQHGGGLVVTYEPLPEMLAELKRNLQINQFDNVRLRSICLGEQPGAADFWINFNRPASSSLVGRDPSATHVSTLVFRLDDVFPLEKLERLDYVKIDVEGAEAQVLAGARATLKKYRPIVQMEIGIENAALGLPDYTEWQSPGGPNKVCIPDESPKNEVARQLGWQKISQPSQ
jgi:FkbM family methyltransferase